MTFGVRIEAPAKVNIRLVVLARQANGYHSLETLLCGVSLTDRIELAPGGPGIDLEISSEDIDTGPPSGNLVVRTAAAFYERLGVEPALRVRLEKRIPSAAGLGGGSSDAASTLRGLNALHGEPLDFRTLLELAAGLGSDVPFFLAPTPFALGWGRGERLLALEPPPACPAIIVRTGVDIRTPEAFGRLAELREEGVLPPAASVAIDRRELRTWEELARLAGNDFDLVARERIAAFEEIQRLLVRGGASIALLAGSGGAIFGLFPRGASPAPALHSLGDAGFAAWEGSTIRRWPPVRRFRTRDGL